MSLQPNPTTKQCSATQSLHERAMTNPAISPFDRTDVRLVHHALAMASAL